MDPFEKVVFLFFVGCASFTLLGLGILVLKVVFYG